MCQQVARVGDRQEVEWTPFLRRDNLAQSIDFAVDIDLAFFKGKQPAAKGVAEHTYL